LGLAVFAFFEASLWTNTDADLTSARHAFGEVDGDGGFRFVHGESTIK